MDVQKLKMRHEYRRIWFRMFRISGPASIRKRFNFSTKYEKLMTFVSCEWHDTLFLYTHVQSVHNIAVAKHPRHIVTPDFELSQSK